MPQFMVTGLSELRSALLKAEKIEPAQIKSMLKEVSAEVISKAQPRLRSQIHDPRSTGRLEASMKPSATVRTASIVLGTPIRTAYAGWWEFGGPKRKSRRPPNRDYVKEGRSLYPSLADAREEIQATTEKVVAALAQLIINEG